MCWWKGQLLLVVFLAATRRHEGAVSQRAPCSIELRGEGGRLAGGIVECGHASGELVKVVMPPEVSSLLRFSGVQAVAPTPSTTPPSLLTFVDQHITFTSIDIQNLMLSDQSALLVSGGSATITSAAVAGNTLSEGSLSDEQAASSILTFKGMEEVDIQDSRFLNNVGLWGGAMSLVNVTSVRVDGSLFRGNRAGQYGGALDLEACGEVTIINTNFENNSVLNQEAMQQSIPDWVDEYDTWWGGGAVYLSDGGEGTSSTASFTDCNFTDNTATDGGQGGAILSIEKPLKVRACDFKGNTAALGGACAVYKSQGQSHVMSSRFIHNVANIAGGALSMIKSSLIMTSTLLADNAAKVAPSARTPWTFFVRAPSGGAVFMTLAQLYINTTNFVNNTAVGDGGDSKGGAVFTIRTQMNLDLCTFKNNTAVVGGAIDVDQGDGHFRIQNNVFMENRARRAGGALFEYMGSLYEDTSLTLRNNTFSGNIVGTHGGAVACRACVRMRVVGNTFLKNSATFGGASSMPQVICLYELGNVYQGNTAQYGGAQYVGQISGDLNGCVDDKELETLATAGGIEVENNPLFAFMKNIYVNNRAEVDGGALILNDYQDKGVLHEILAQNNSAGGQGGFLLLTSNTRSCYECMIRVTQCRLLGNSAARDGGAIAYLGDNIGAILHVWNSTLENNTAEGHGGVVYGADHAVLWLTNGTTARHNQAYGGSGGLLHCDSCKSVFIHQVLADNNSAGDSGGAIACTNCWEMVINTTNFINNTAQRGGAVDYPLSLSTMNSLRQTARIPLLLLLSSTFVENRAVGAGGAEMVLSAESYVDARGTGGAVRLWGPYLISLGSTFYNNSADNLGGLAFLGALCTNEEVPAVRYLPFRSIIHDPEEPPANPRDGDLSTLVNKIAPGVQSRLLGRGNCSRQVMVSSTLSGNQAGSAGAVVFLAHPGSLISACGPLAHSATSLAEVELLIDQQGKQLHTGIETCQVVLTPAGPQEAQGALPVAGGPVALRSRSLNQTQRPYTIVGYRSGSQLRTEGGLALVVELVDVVGQHVSWQVPSSLITINGSYTSPGSSSTELQVVGAQSLFAMNGTARLDNLIVRARPGSEVLLTISMPQMPEVQPLLVKLMVGRCLTGEATTANGLECEVCRYNSFNSLDPTLPCTSCPTHGICPGGTMLVPRAGYWHSSPLSDQIHMCPNAQACGLVNLGQGVVMGLTPDMICTSDQGLRAARLACCQHQWLQRLAAGSGQVTNSSELVSAVRCQDPLGAVPYQEALCAPGYTGNLCGVCQVDDKVRYGFTRYFNCRRCPNPLVALGVYVGATLMSTAILLYSTMKVLRENTQGSQADIESSHYLHLLVLHVQCAGIIAQLANSTMTSLVILGKVTGGLFAGLAAVMLAPVDCFLSTSSSMPVAVQRVLLLVGTMVLQLCLVLLLIVMWRTWAQRRGARTYVQQGDTLPELHGLDSPVPAPTAQNKESDDSVGLVRDQARHRGPRPPADQAGKKCFAGLCDRIRSPATDILPGLSPAVASLLMVLVMLVLIHPTWTNTTLSMFACVNIDTEPAISSAARGPFYQAVSPRGFWIGNLNMRCYQGWHLTLVGVVGAPMLLVTLMVPAVCGAVLWRNRHRLAERSVQASLLFLYHRYRPPWYLWECAVLLFPLFVNTAAAFGYREGTTFQACAIMVILCLWVVVQAVGTPYNRQRLLLSSLASAFGLMLITMSLLQLRALDAGSALTQQYALAFGWVALGYNLLLMTYLLGQALADVGGRLKRIVPRLVGRNHVGRS